MFAGIIIVQFLVMGLIFAIVLRAAVWLFNRFFGKNVTSPFRAGDEARPIEFENYEVIESGPYTPPSTYVSGGQATTEVVGVPVPSFGKAIVVCIATLMAQGGVQLVLAVAMPATASVAFMLSLASNVVGFAVLAGMLKLMLPTSLARSLAVAGIFYSLLIGIGAMITMVLSLFWFFTAR